MGPLAALATAVASLPPAVTLLQTAPCDTPLLPADLVSRLQAALGDADAAMPVTAHGPQPACLLLRVTVLAGLPAYLAAGWRSTKSPWAGRASLVARLAAALRGEQAKKWPAYSRHNARIRMLILACHAAPDGWGEQVKSGHCAYEPQHNTESDCSIGMVISFVK